MCIFFGCGVIPFVIRQDIRESQAVTEATLFVIENLFCIGRIERKDA